MNQLENLSVVKVSNYTIPMITTLIKKNMEDEGNVIDGKVELR